MNISIEKKSYLGITSSKEISRLIIFLGFVTPFPIFISAQKFSLILFEFDYDFIKVVADDLTPIPIGLFSLSIYIFIVLLRTKSLFYLLKYGLFISLLLFVFLQGFDFLRIPLLIAPIIFFLFLRKIIIDRYFLKDGFIKGYLIGLLAVYSSNIFSYLFLSFKNLKPFDLQYARQIFGYEIWQYYVTYSAIASLAFGTFALLIFFNFREIKKLRKFIILILIFSFIACCLPLRKAALIDIFLISFLMIGGSINDFFNLKIKKYKFIFITLISFLSLIAIWITLDIREGVNYMTRVSPIVKALDLIEIDPFKIFFGFQRGFGGYSNLLVELFLRSGLLGLTTYISFIFYSFRIYISALKNINGLEKFNNGNILIFISFNLIVGNLVNLNFATPYFVVNFVSILIIFSYLDILIRSKKYQILQGLNLKLLKDTN